MSMRQLAKAAWEAQELVYKATGKHKDKPSSRKVEIALKAQGFEKAHYRSIARWKANDWREDSVARVPDMQSRTHRQMNEMVKTALQRMPDSVNRANTIAESGGLQPAVEAGKIGNPDRIAARRRELAAMSPEKRQEEIAKAREIMNIILMEEATLNADAMILLPITAPMVDAMTDAAKSTLIVETPIGPTHAGPHGAKQVNGRIIEHDADPVGVAIDNYLAEADAA